MLFILANGIAGGPRAGGGGSEATLDDGQRATRSPKPVFIRAWLNNLANPKVILFYLAFLPQFVTPAAGSVTLQLLALGFVFLLLGLIVDVAHGVFSGQIGDWLRQRASLRRALDRVAGTIIGALGVRLLIAGRHS